MALEGEPRRQDPARADQRLQRWADTDDNALACDEYVFVYDIFGGMPIKPQVLTVPDSFMGIAGNPNGEELYVAGGVDDNFEKQVAIRRGARHPLAQPAVPQYSNS